MNKKLIPGVDYIGITTPFYCIDGKSKILLHKRSHKCRDERGMWDPGGGKLEFGETLDECVLREVKEEYGCKGIIKEQLSAISVLRDQNGVKTHWLAVPFIILVNPKEVINNDPEKIDEMGWFTLDSLPKPLHSAFAKHIFETSRRKIIEKYLH